MFQLDMPFGSYGHWFDREEQELPKKVQGTPPVFETESDSILGDVRHLYMQIDFARNPRSGGVAVSGTASLLASVTTYRCHPSHSARAQPTGHSQFVGQYFLDTKKYCAQYWTISQSPNIRERKIDCRKLP